MKKSTYIIILVFFICCNKNNEVKNLKERNLDQTFIDLKEKKYDSLVRKELKKLAFQYGDNKKLNFDIHKYIDLKSTIVNDAFGKTEANTNLGLYYFGKFQNDSAFYYFSKAEKISRFQKNKPFMGTILQCKADLLWSQKNFTEAESTAIKALKIAIERKNDDLMYSCYITLGNSLTGLNNFEKAIEYYEKAVYKSNDLKSNSYHKILKASAYNYIAIIYQNRKQYNKSMQFVIEALKFDNFKKIESKLYCYLTNNLAYSKFKLGDKSSLNQFQETLKIGDSIKSIPIIITSKTYLGEYYLTEKDTLKANFYLKDAQLQAHKNNIYEDELKILQLLTEANPVKESFYNNRYIQLNDSLQNVERATRDKFARIEFETEEITQENKIIFKKNTDLYNSLWFIIGISILSLMLFYLLYKNKIQKAKNREMLLIQQQQEAEIRELNLLQEQKIAEEEIYQLIIAQQNKYEEGKNSEKERMSLELHDNILSSLGGLNSNLEAQMIKLGLVNNIQFNKILNGLLNVQNDARKIAHDLIKNIFINNSESFIDVVTELTTNIKNHTAIHFNVEATTTVNWEVVNNTVKINLYRIIQEALHNIEKYAQAKNVTVFIDQQDNTLELAIIDDGKGFDSTTNKEGVGLRNMKTRTDSLNGFIIITSEVKKGTKINLTVPI